MMCFRFVFVCLLMGWWSAPSLAGFIVVPLRSTEDWKFVEVRLPDSGQVLLVSDEGVHDVAGKSVRWGPLAPNLRAVTFTLKDVPAGGNLPLLASPSGAAAINTLALPVDADQDGLPKSVEEVLGLSDADAGDSKGDLDGDGVDNLTEYLAGTDPMDSKLRPAVRTVVYDTELESLLIDLPDGRTDTLRIETAIRLDAENWQTFTDWEVLEGKPVRLKIAVSKFDLSIRFFRLHWGG